MQWVDVNKYLPGITEKRDILVRLSNGEKQILGNRELLGEWLAKDRKTIVRVTHWMAIEEA